jgi:hypothetical protein
VQSESWQSRNEKCVEREVMVVEVNGRARIGASPSPSLTTVLDIMSTPAQPRRSRSGKRPPTRLRVTFMLHPYVSAHLVSAPGDVLHKVIGHLARPLGLIYPVRSAEAYWTQTGWLEVVWFLSWGIVRSIGDRLAHLSC